MPLKLKLDQFEPYIKSRYQLIPLFPYTKTTNGREDGKRPRDPSWTTKPYKNKDQIALATSKGNNLGVRLTAHDLVIDVDPRNMKDEDGTELPDTYLQLCEDLNLDFSGAPTVVTGSGGLHIYLKKPEDISVVDTLADYPGVEFKTKGRQVVAAGSIHPSAKKHYEWDELEGELSDPVPTPDALLNIIKRPDRKHVVTGSGEYDQEQVAKMLDTLDPEDFQDQDEWLGLMMACHHASNGDARSEFVEWSTRDPQYQTEAWIIGRRWDSLHTDTAGAITAGTLRHYVMKRGDQSSIPRTSAQDDFKDIDPPKADDDAWLDGLDDDEEFEPEDVSFLRELNEKYISTMDMGKHRIMYQETDDWDRSLWVGSTVTDFHSSNMYKRLEEVTPEGKIKVTQATKAWLEWPEHRKADGIVFDPERDHPGKLNLWTGWPIEPKKGNWSILDDLIKDVLCDGDEASYEYVLNWLAYMVQFPGRPAETALCFYGGKGTGKSTLGKIAAELCGRHGITVNNPKMLTGNFNAHLRDAICLFADEAIRPQSKADENVLKALVTDDRNMIEPKGLNARMEKSRLHIIMASNEAWIVPASLDERRYFVSQVKAKPRSAEFFIELYDHMLGGDRPGLRAMFWDLKTRNISDWSPRGCIPDNGALADQKVASLEPIGQWWAHILEEGILPFDTTKEDDNWEEDFVAVFKEEVRSHFQLWCRESGGIKPGGMGRNLNQNFTREWKSICPKVYSAVDTVDDELFPHIKSRSDGRAQSYRIPDLNTCRDQFAKVVGETDLW